MARNWTSRPPGTVAIRLDVTPEVAISLSALAGSVRAPVSRLMRRVAEEMCNSETVQLQKILAELKQEFLDAIEARDSKPKRPRGRPRKSG